VTSLARAFPEPAPDRTATVGEAMLRIAKVHGLATTVGELRELFRDHHVHAAVIVAGRRLVAVIEPADLTAHRDDREPAMTVGLLTGRTVGPGARLEPTRWSMLRTGRRRLAVVDGDGDYLGLLCLKRSGLGFCSERDVRARQHDRVH